MAKFTRYNNPARRRRKKAPVHSDEYRHELLNSARSLAQGANTDYTKQAVMDALRITLNP